MLTFLKIETLGRTLKTDKHWNISWAFRRKHNIFTSGKKLVIFTCEKSTVGIIKDAFSSESEREIVSSVIDVYIMNATLHSHLEIRNLFSSLVHSRSVMKCSLTVEEKLRMSAPAAMYFRLYHFFYGLMTLVIFYISVPIPGFSLLTLSFRSSWNGTRHLFVR